jgi:hypothetical protein
MFGGATISLILPKLIRSVARDGICNLFVWPATRRLFSQSTTQGKPAVFNGKPTGLLTDFSVSTFDKF